MGRLPTQNQATTFRTVLMMLERLRREDGITSPTPALTASLQRVSLHRHVNVADGNCTMQ
jgi:hypothetical protein